MEVSARLRFSGCLKVYRLDIGMPLAAIQCHCNEIKVQILICKLVLVWSMCSRLGIVVGSLKSGHRPNITVICDRYIFLVE